MRSFERASTLLPHVIAALLLLGCGGSDSPTAPATPPTPPPISPAVAPTIKATAGDSATAIVGETTAQWPTVVVTDTLGKHPSGLTVTFTPDSGCGSVEHPSATTDAFGSAAAGLWTLGAHSGVQHLTASVTVDGTTLHVVFTATAKTVIPANLVLLSGGTQNGPIGATLVTPLVVRAVDKGGVSMRGVEIHFRIDSGAVITSGIITGPDGLATTRVRLPYSVGSVVVTASVDSGPSVQSTFTSHGVQYARMAVSANDACGLSVEGYVYCWGDNAVGQLTELGITGRVVSSSMGTSGFSSTLTSLSLESIGGCGIQPDHSAVCWGSNTFGNNGNGQDMMGLEPPTPVAGQLAFAEVTRGPSATCGTTTGGQSYCWGGGGLGQLGNATYYSSTAAQPVPIDGGITFHGYAMGTLHTCALDPGGQAYCWGADWDGRLGVAAASKPCDETLISGTTSTVILQSTCAPSPVAVNTSTKFTALAATSASTCGLTSAGDVYCWGNNDGGALATGDTISSATPAKVANLPPIRELHGGDRIICGLTAAGEIYCWGLGPDALGAPPVTCGNNNGCYRTPIKLPTTLQFSTIAVTTSDICGIAGGVAYCWGDNYNGALGTGSTALRVTTPAPILGQTP